MASAFLGPEKHTPLAVIAESYQGRLKLPFYQDEDKFRFGAEYEKKLFSLVHEHLELDITDKLIYVGDLKGSLAQVIQNYFCLIQPVMYLVPGYFHYIEAHQGCHILPVRIQHVGAEEYFRKEAEDGSSHKVRHDKILLHDCLRSLDLTPGTIKDMAACLAPHGRILIIHRDRDLNTLPVFSDGKVRLTESNVCYSDIIRRLEQCGLEVTWDVVHLPVCLPKRKWLAMIRDKFPSQMEFLSNTELVSGIRELSEGILKYEGELVEFWDRLVFISASLPPNKTNKSGSILGKRAEATLLPNVTSSGHMMYMSHTQLLDLMGNIT